MLRRKGLRACPAYSVYRDIIIGAMFVGGTIMAARDRQNEQRLVRTMDLLPSTHSIADRLTDVSRELKLLRGLLRLAEQAEHWRRLDGQANAAGPKKRKDD
jgi:hypothetical protein